MPNPRHSDNRPRVLSTLDPLFLGAFLTILGLRAFLALSGYPQLGGGALHIAHMLWGGLFLLIAVIMLLSPSGQRYKFSAAWLAGIGFGFFIDEVGKFITSTNDYFYQPAATIIYLILLALWFATNRLEKLSSSQSDRPSALDHVITVWQDSFLAVAIRLADTGRAVILICFLMVAQAAINLAYLVITSRTLFTRGDIDIWEVGQRSQFVIVVGSTISLILVLVALTRLILRRPNAYRIFAAALVVSVFITQPFYFYIEQFKASFVLVFNLGSLWFVRAQNAVQRPKIKL